MQANFIVEFVLVRNDIPKKNVWISILSEIVGKKPSQFVVVANIGNTELKFNREKND